MGVMQFPVWPRDTQAQLLEQELFPASYSTGLRRQEGKCPNNGFSACDLCESLHRNDTGLKKITVEPIATVSACLRSPK